MTTMTYQVIHPLYDHPEEKCNIEGLGTMAMRPVVKYALLSLRLYLILMGALVAYRICQETGII